MQKKYFVLNIFHLTYNSGTAEQDSKYSKVDPLQPIVIMGEYRYNSTYSLPQHQMEVSSQLHTPGASPFGKSHQYPPIHPVRMLQRREKSLAAARNQTIIPWQTSLQPSHHTAIPSMLSHLFMRTVKVGQGGVRKNENME